jgi:hypothetical protein
MKLIISFILNLLVLSTFSQSYKVDYKVKYNQKWYENRLIITDTSCVWLELTEDENNTLKDMFLVKNNNKNIVYYSDILFDKTFYISDSLHPMKWELEKDTIIILGIKCNSATTRFRGREYIAYYAASLPFSTGPWKFGGLPGLILFVKSKDSEYEYSAVNQEINFTFTKTINIQQKKYITWKSFNNEFITTIDRVVKRMKSIKEADDRGYLKIDAPEIIYKNVQLGNGIEF